MKKIAAMTAIVALVSMPVLAAGQGGYTGPSATTPASSTTQGGGFTGPSGAVTTVTNVKSLRDDTWVTLRGKITERVSDDLYKFQDATGVI
ncbi:NirD/YgiW/YdeI family stress tolerance protein, partial [Klebsiella pneumoniae]|nr:NirD/YgiW/YdeI family stress tolerance protein [Klebsiella pneumoniae]